MADKIRELDGGQELLTQKVEQLKSALYALVGENTAAANVASTPYVSVNAAREVLDQTFPI